MGIRKIFTITKLHDLASIQEMSIPKHMYDEGSFRLLLQTECQRARPPGQSGIVCLAYCHVVSGSVPKLRPPCVEALCHAFSQCLRETDYIGWYAHNRVVGGVLTVVAQESEEELADRIRNRVEKILERKSGTEECRQIQVYFYPLHSFAEI